METRQLAAFCAVVERGSFSQAAESLGVTQPAVSMAVRALEKRLGATLLDRSSRQLTPTRAGWIVAARAQRMLQLEDEIGETLRDEATSVSGRLEIGASTGPGTRLLPRLLVAFRRVHPSVEVAMRVESTQEIVDRVLARQLELGVVGAERTHRSLEYEPFFADEIVLAVPSGHEFAGRELTLDELRRTPLVIQQEGSGIRSLIERELRRNHLRLKDLDVVAELGLQESSCSAVEQGLGVTFTSRASIERELDLGVLAEARVAGIAVARSYVLVRVAGREPSRLAAAFVEYCQTELAGARETAAG